MDGILVGALLAAAIAWLLAFAVGHVSANGLRRASGMAVLFGPPLVLVATVAVGLLSNPRDAGQGFGLALIIYGPAILLWIVLGGFGYRLGRWRRRSRRESGFL